MYRFINIILNRFFAWAKLIKIAVNNRWHFLLELLTRELTEMQILLPHTIFVRANEEMCTE